VAWKQAERKRKREQEDDNGGAEEEDEEEDVDDDGDDELQVMSVKKGKKGKTAEVDHLILKQRAAEQEMREDLKDTRPVIGWSPCSQFQAKIGLTSFVLIEFAKASSFSFSFSLFPLIVCFLDLVVPLMKRTQKS